MNQKNNDSNSGDNPFSDSTELFDSIFDEEKKVDQKPTPKDESSPQNPVTPDSDSQDGAFSDSMELFDDIFHEDTDIEKPGPSGKETTPATTKKTVKGPEAEKRQGMQMPGQPVSPTKTAPPVKPQQPAPTPKISPPAPVKKAQRGPEPEKRQGMQMPGPVVRPTEKEPPGKVQPPGPTPDKISPPAPVKKAQRGPEPEKRQGMQMPGPVVRPTEKEPPGKVQPPGPTPDKISPSPPLKKPQQTPRPQKGPPVPPTEKLPSAPLGLSGERRRSQTKAKKGVNTLVFISSIVVLVIVSMLTGMILDYGDVLDRLNITGYFKANTQTTESSRRSSPVKTHEKSQIEISNIHDPLATTKSAPPAISSVSIENVLPEETLSLTKTQEVSTVEEVSEEQEATAVSTEPSSPGKPMPDHTAVLETKSLSYPYSIYLGSYSSHAAVKKAASDYEEMGLSPYWVKLDLGDKGIWFRLFEGYFQKRQDADEFIKTRQIPGADTKNTPYANLIGIYASEEQLGIQKETLEGLGYSPYTISDTENVYRLYVGVFYQEERAKEQGAELSLKGIKSQLVER